MTARRIRTMALSAMIAAACSCAGQAAAQTPGGPLAPPLGRLFSTPDERAMLDGLRVSGGLTASPAGAAPAMQEAGPASAPPPAPPPALTLNGVVRRSNGRSTVWLNQVPQDEQSRRLPKSAGSAAALSLQSSDGRTVWLKPGQRYDLNDATVKELDER